MKTTLPKLGLFLLIGGLLVAFASPAVYAQTLTPRSTPQNASFTSLPVDYTATTAQKNKVTISHPQQGEKIVSPLYIKGKAPGTWFFEGSFSVKIVDSYGNILGTGIATSRGEWMTEKMVPFTAVISFSASPAGATKGYIVFEKSNPSGLPAFEDNVKLPIKL